MDTPVVIGLSPHRSNIHYSVRPYLSLEDLTTMIKDEILSHTIKTKKTVIFCCKLDDSSLLYVSLRKTLGEYFTFSIGYPDCQPYGVVDMFTCACKVEMKEAILKTFSEVGGKLRVVIAKTAFGMGIDCSDIERIIHWGMPGSLEQYVHETGRAGRDGRPAQAILLYGKAGKYVKEVHTYAKNETDFRRKILYHNFLFYDSSLDNVVGCNCCDVCSIKCVCDNCTRN